MKNKSSVINRIVSLALMLFVAISMLAMTSPSFGQKQHIKDVLYINSYHRGYDWSDDIYKGIEFGLFAYSESINLVYEQMDAKRYSSMGNLELFTKQMESKYDQDSFDVIVVSDDAAFDFMKMHGQRIFGDTPFVFCGVNNIYNVDKENHLNYTGVLEIQDYEKTIKTAISIHKGIDTIYYVADSTLTSIILVEQLKKATESLNLKLEKLKGENSDELIKSANELGENNLIILATFSLYEKTVSELDYAIKFIKGVKTVPIYGTEEKYLRVGLAGGYMSNGYDQGFVAGDMVVDILRGYEAGKIDVLDDVPKELWFNYEVLSEKGIDMSILPENSNITKYNPENKKNIIIIHSHDYSLKSDRDFEAGIVDELNNEGLKYNIFNEYLNMGNVYMKQNNKSFYELLNQKYNNIRVDAYVLHGEESYRVTKKYKSIINGGPLIFSKINSYKDINEKVYNATGIIDMDILFSNVELAQILNPNVKQIIFITDKTEKGINLTNKAKKYEPIFKDDLEFIYWNDFSLDEINQKSSMLGNSSMIIYLNFSKDSKNNIYIHDGAFESIVSHSRVPVIVLRDELIGAGAIGGKIVSGHKTGEDTGKILVAALKGKAIKNIPVRIVDNSVYVFDYEVLKDNNINLRSLPSGSILRNQ